MIDFFEMAKKGPVLMGVVNVTPDSFSDGGAYLDASAAIEHGLKLWDEGADILDVGGESTRPGAVAVSVEEELARILPVIEGIKAKQPQAVISVDTRHAATMRSAIAVGADIINDVSALTHDKGAIEIVKETQIPVMLMHMQGTPENMQDRPHYDDVVSDVYAYLESRVQVCEAVGLKRHQIICDPGIGFGKTLEDNLKILKNLDKFHDLSCAILLGASRKSFIEKIVPNTPADERLAGSIAAAIKGFEQGVQYFRVHDVKETRQAFEVWEAIS